MDLKLYPPQNAVGNVVWSQAVMWVQSHHLLHISPHREYFKACVKHQDACRIEILQFLAGKSMNSN